MEITQFVQINGHSIAATLHKGSNNKHLAIFCHGYRGSSIGPSRLFVDMARELERHGIDSLRFDQYGSGNSEGNFFDSSFADWIKTTIALVTEHQQQGYQVSLVGQSMGAANVIAVASELDGISSVVAWVPDPNVERFIEPDTGYFEEGGQRVQSSFWREAYELEVAQQLRKVAAPTYIVQCENDEYVSAENHRAIERNAQKHHKVEMLPGHKHSSWTYEQGRAVIKKSVDFLLENRSK